MLLGASLSKEFWVEALYSACCLINRCHNIATELKAPMEMWVNHKTYCNHLKCFWYAAYSHFKEDKLSGRAIKIIFLGYLDGFKGFKLSYLEEGI